MPWPVNIILQGIARHKRLAIVGCASAVVDLTLSIILVPRIGMIRAASGASFRQPCLLSSPCPGHFGDSGLGAAEYSEMSSGRRLTPLVPTVLVLMTERALIRPASLLALAGAGGCGARVYVLVHAFECFACRKQNGDSPVGAGSREVRPDPREHAAPVVILTCFVAVGRVGS